MATVAKMFVQPSAEDVALVKLQDAAEDLLKAARVALAVLEEIQEEEGMRTCFSVPAQVLRDAIAKATV